VFNWRLGYELDYHYFERAPYQGLNNIQHYVETRGAFKFLPRTALIYDARYGWINYTSDTPSQNGGENLRSRIGINSLLTARLTAMIFAGWQASFYDQTANIQTHNYDSVTGQAELRYFFQPRPQLQPGYATTGMSSIALGAVRDFNNSYLADYFGRNRVYASLAYFIGGRALIELQGGYSRIQHPEFATGGATVPEVRENRADAQLFAEYRPAATVGINTTLRYDASLSDANVNLPTYTDNLAYSRFQAWLGARLFM
jgi:hypothetical protein